MSGRRGDQRRPTPRVRVFEVLQAHRRDCASTKALHVKEFQVSTSDRRDEHTTRGVEEHLESDDYLKKRQLKSGSAGWLLLAGLGVSYVISGDYSGWNFGLEQGGFGGL